MSRLRRPRAAVIVLTGSLLVLGTSTGATGAGPAASGNRVAAAPGPTSAVAWSRVGNGGNAADASGYGAVQDPYSIATKEVTNKQYVDFLIAVGSIADPNALYNPQMGSHALGGISRSGDAEAGYAYVVRSGFAEKPVNFVSFHDAIRFANWLNNDKATGEQSAGTTEDGSYTITAASLSGNWISRNSTATIVLPNEDEWYKAAYYDARNSRYFAYTGGSNKAPTCTKPTDMANSANCDGPGLDSRDTDVDGLTEVGAFSGTLSPYGTADQGGNVWEWNETIVSGAQRGLRGGSSDSTVHSLAALTRGSTDPTGENAYIGFRVAMAPHPRTLTSPPVPNSSAQPPPQSSGGKPVPAPNTSSSPIGPGVQGAPGKDDQVTPGKDDQVTPGKDDQVTPGKDDQVTPGNELLGEVDRGSLEKDSEIPEIILLLLLLAALLRLFHNYRRTRRGGTP